MRGKTPRDTPGHGNSLPVRGIYGSKEAREYLGGMSEITFRRKTRSGELRARKIGNRVVCTKEDLDAFIAALPPVAASQRGGAA